MAVPSKDFDTITDGQVDADSPLDTTLITSIRDALINLQERLGTGLGTEAQNHAHTGADGSAVLGTPSVQSDGSQFVAASGTWTPSTGTYQVTTDITVANDPYLQLFISSAWRGTPGNKAPGIIYADGTSMRFSTSLAVTFWWQKFN